MGPGVFTEQPVFRLFLFPFSVSLPPSRGLFPISRLAVSRLRKNRDTLLSGLFRAEEGSSGGGGGAVIINAPPFKRGNIFTRVEKERKKKKKPRKLFDSIRFDSTFYVTRLLFYSLALRIEGDEAGRSKGDGDGGGSPPPSSNYGGRCCHALWQFPSSN